MKNNITSNRDYATENINLRQQIIDLEVANKDKAETIKSMNKELLEYSELRKRFKVLYEENQKYMQLSNELGCPLEVVFKAFKDRYVIFKHVVGVENPIIKLETHKVLGLICVCEKFRLELCDGVFGDEFYVDTKDYGESWWLKGDRSE